MEVFVGAGLEEVLGAVLVLVLVLVVLLLVRSALCDWIRPCKVSTLSSESSLCVAVPRGSGLRRERTTMKVIELASHKNQSG